MGDYAQVPSTNIITIEDQIAKCNEYQRPNPHDQAGFLNKIHFHWVRDYINNTEYASKLPQFLNSEEMYKRLEDAWEEETEKENPSFFRALMKAYAWKMVYYCSGFGADVFLQALLGVMLGLLIQVLMLDEEPFDGAAWAYGGILILIATLSIYLRHITWFYAQMLSGAIRQSSLQLLHDKITRLSHEVFDKEADAGRMINIATTDIDMFEYLSLLNALWFGPLFFVVAMVTMYMVAGVAGVIGLSIIALLIPICIINGRLIFAIRQRVAKISDKRLKLTTEIIEGIRILKQFGWEDLFRTKVNDIRSQEVVQQRLKGYVRGIKTSLFLSAQGIGIFVTLLTYTWMSETLTPTVMFTSLSIMISAQFFLTIKFPLAIEFLAHYRAGSDRFTEVLLLPEQQPVQSSGAIGEVKCDTIKACWGSLEIQESEEEQLQTQFALTGNALSIAPGELVMVTGSIGSGKSSWLLAILGEMNITEGSVTSNGTIGYLEQEPWIVNGTIAENVTIGRKFDKARYAEVISVCCLSEDIAIIGEATVVGDRGTTLSGGQKARVGLARAVYADCDIYLLDDPLSALDTQVARSVFEKCIVHYLEGKTRILVTHQVQYAQSCDCIMYFSKGHGERIHDIGKIDLTEIENQPRTRQMPDDDMVIPAGCPFSGQRVSQVRRPNRKTVKTNKATAAKQKESQKKWPAAHGNRTDAIPKPNEASGKCPFKHVDQQQEVGKCPVQHGQMPEAPSRCPVSHTQPAEEMKKCPVDHVKVQEAPRRCPVTHIQADKEIKKCPVDHGQVQEAPRRCPVAHDKPAEEVNKCPVDHGKISEAPRCPVSHAKPAEEVKKCPVDHGQVQDAPRLCPVSHDKPAEEVKRCPVDHGKISEAPKRCPVSHDQPAEEVKKCPVDHATISEAPQCCPVSNDKPAKEVKKCPVDHGNISEAPKRCPVSHDKPAEEVKKCPVDHGTISKAPKRCPVSHNQPTEEIKKCPFDHKALLAKQQTMPESTNESVKRCPVAHGKTVPAEPEVRKCPIAHNSTSERTCPVEHHSPTLDDCPIETNSIGLEIQQIQTNPSQESSDDDCPELTGSEEGELENNVRFIEKAQVHPNDGQVPSLDSQEKEKRLSQNVPKSMTCPVLPNPDSRLVDSQSGTAICPSRSSDILRSRVHHDSQNESTDSSHSSNDNSRTKPEKKCPIPHGQLALLGNQDASQRKKSTTDKLAENDAKVTFGTYCKFLAQGHPFLIPIFVVLYFVVQAVYLAVPYWLCVWAESPDSSKDDPFFWHVLGIIVIMLLVLGLTRNMLFYQNILSASRRVHDSMLTALTRASVAWFDKNPCGDIMSRVSKDVAMTDDFLTWMATDMMQVVFITFGSIIAITVSNPIMIAIVIPMIYCLILFSKKAVGPSRKANREMLASKAPIFSQISLVRGNLFSIRAFGLTSYFKEKFEQLAVANSLSFYSHYSIIQWLHFRNDMAGLVFICVNVFATIALQDWLDRRMIALSLSLTTTIIINLVWTMYQLVSVESKMASPERMFQYAAIPAEPGLDQQRAFTVQRGEIKFEEVELRYDDNVALVNCNFHVYPGERVGIVGKTGAGKSSIIQGIFRLKEICGGKICIDGQDISRVNLHTLRSQISVIPQTPFLFATTVRDNLDPKGIYTDTNLWHALSAAKIDHLYRETETELDSPMHSHSLSIGQKQLFCLARAILQRNKILILDEATANVDYDTDQIIQNSIRSEFAGCTMLTIAHRVNTILDADRVMVIEAGRVVEFDKPLHLMQKESSDLFRYAKQVEIVS